MYIYIYLHRPVHWNAWNMELNHPQNHMILRLKSRDTRFLYMFIYIYIYTHPTYSCIFIRSWLHIAKMATFPHIYSKLPSKTCMAKAAKPSSWVLQLRWVTLGSNLLMAGLHPSIFSKTAEKQRKTRTLGVIFRKTPWVFMMFRITDSLKKSRWMMDHSCFPPFWGATQYIKKVVLHHRHQLHNDVPRSTLKSCSFQ